MPTTKHLRLVQEFDQIIHKKVTYGNENYKITLIQDINVIYR